MSLPEPKPVCVACGKEITNLADYLQYPGEIRNKKGKVTKRISIPYHKKCFEDEG